MKRIAFLFVAVITATGVIAWMAPSSLAQDNKGQATKTQTGTKEAKQIIVTTIPRGYRDWKFISAAYEAGELNDIRVAIGNDKAIKAYRAGKPFPEGTIIGRRPVWTYLSSLHPARLICARIDHFGHFAGFGTKLGATGSETRVGMRRD
jgi:hypothetical protein